LPSFLAFSSLSHPVSEFESLWNFMHSSHLPLRSQAVYVQLHFFFPPSGMAFPLSWLYAPFL